MAQNSAGFIADEVIKSVYGLAQNILSIKDGVVFYPSKIAASEVQSICDYICSYILLEKETSFHTEFIRKGSTLDISSSGDQVAEINAADIFSALDSGYTLVSNHLEYILPNVIGHLLGKLRADDYAGHINLYWSPPNSYGAGLHSDDHNVLIIQLHGQKIWFLNEGEAKVTLNAGDVLYVPCGYRHNPKSCDCSSIHLTLGLDESVDQIKAARASENFSQCKGYGNYELPLSDLITVLDEFMLEAHDEMETAPRQTITQTGLEKLKQIINEQN